MNNINNNINNINNNKPIMSIQWLISIIMANNNINNQYDIQY